MNRAASARSARPSVVHDEIRDRPGAYRRDLHMLVRVRLRYPRSGRAVADAIKFDEIDQHQVVRWSCCIDAFFVLGAFLLRRDAHRKLRLCYTQWSSIGSQRAQVLAQPSLLAKLPGFSKILRRKCQGRPTVHTKSEGLGYIDRATHFRSFPRDRHALRETLQAL